MKWVVSKKSNELKSYENCQVFSLDLATSRFAKKEKKCNSYHLPVPQLSHLGNEEVWTLCYLRVPLGLPFFDSKTKVPGKFFQGRYSLCSFHFPLGPSAQRSQSCQVNEQGSKTQTTYKSHITWLCSVWDLTFFFLLPTLKAIFSHSLISVYFVSPIFSCKETWVP